MNSTIIPPNDSGDIIINYLIPGLNESIEIPFHLLDSFQTDQTKLALIMGITIGSCSMTLIFLISIMYKTNKLSNIFNNNINIKTIFQWINQMIFNEKINLNKHKQNDSYNNNIIVGKGFYKLFLFYLNSLILLIGIIRSGCYLNYNLGPLNSISFVFTGWYNESISTSKLSFISSDITNGFKCILYGLVEISLGFQVYIMFKTSNLKIWGLMASLLSISLGLIVVALQINLTILSHIRFVKATTTTTTTNNNETSTSIVTGGYVINSIWMDLPTILFSISINIMTILLIGKLIIAIRIRRYLGLKQFDSFHILLIGFSQTLIIPSIILIIHYFYLSKSKDSLLQQISLLLIILMLPLSSLWAQTANNIHNINSSPSLSFISRHHLSDNNSNINTIVNGNINHRYNSNTNSNSNSNSNGNGNGKFSKLNTNGSSPFTLKGDSGSLMLQMTSNSNNGNNGNINAGNVNAGNNFSIPVSGIDAQLPPDIEKILHDEDNINNYKLLNINNENINDGDIIINDEGMITKQITIKRV